MSQAKPHKFKLPAPGTTVGGGGGISLVCFPSEIWNDQHAFLTGYGEP